jgi:acyl-CoA synthetase (AMP-forming)/AMP-acid ligase II
VRAELWERLQSTAERSANDPAFTFLDAAVHPTPYTFGALFEKAAALGRSLRALRLDASAPFGILLQSQEEQVLHYLAALSIGLRPAIFTPPNRKLSREYFLLTTRAVISTCRFSAVVTNVEGLEIDATLLAPWTLQEAQRRPALAAALMGKAVLLQFSSGTTGIKRGVLLGGEAVLAQFDIYIYSRAIGLSRQDTIVSWLPLYHDMGFIACMHMPLCFGVHCVMIYPLDWVANPVSWLRAVSEHRSTLGWHPNFAFAFMAERVQDAQLAGLDLSSLRGLVNCSEPVTFESQRRFLDRFDALGLHRDVF